MKATYAGASELDRAILELETGKTRPKNIATQRPEQLDLVRGVKGIAEATGLSYDIVLRMLRHHELPGQRLGGADARCHTVSRRALREFFEGRR